MANKKRLIDANEFTEHLERMTRTAYPNLFPGLLEAAEYAKDFPTVDAVEVVRCKDCQHYVQLSGLDNHCRCDIFCGCYDRPYPTEPDDFCSYGERRV